MQMREIVYSTDFSPCARHAFEPAVELARRFEARLHLLHVLVPLYPLVLDPMTYVPPAPETFEELHDEAEIGLEKLALVAERQGVVVVTALERGSEPAEVLVDYARRQQADLLVIGTHGRRGASRLLLGSVAEQALRHSPCPVLAIREAGDAVSVAGLPARLLVPFDFSPAARAALVYAAALARRTGAAITLLHVREALPTIDIAAAHPSREALDRKASLHLEQRLREEGAQHAEDVPLFAAVASGRPAATILRLAERQGSDWIVMATRSLTGLQRLVFGSTAEAVLRSSRRPVLMVNPESVALEAAAESALAHGPLIL
jgi:nucleotide-binding universal stress UspA family protein